MKERQKEMKGTGCSSDLPDAAQSASLYHGIPFRKMVQAIRPDMNMWYKYKILTEKYYLSAVLCLRGTVDSS